MIKKYVFDGVPGSGKTTILLGKDQEGETYKNFKSLNDRGYQIISSNIGKIFDEIRKEGKDPKKEPDEALYRIVEFAVTNFKKCSAKGIFLFDRGIPGYSVFPNWLGGKLPKEFDKYCKRLRYSSPILLFEPILEYDISKPRKRRTNKLFSIEDRLNMHKELKNIYEKWDYEVIEIPIFSKDRDKSLELRVQRVLEIINP